MYSLVELCCGSAALTLHLLKAKRSLLTYQGSKWRFRRELGALLRAHGAKGVPRRVELYDPGPWGTVAGCVVDAHQRAGLIDRLELLGRLDARAVYNGLHGQPVPEDAVEFAAQYLFLQRLAYSGKAVGIREGCWSSPGFNTSSAYGLAGTDRFGEVLPMIPSLVRTLRGYASLVAPERLFSRRVEAPLPELPLRDPTVVYIDPPYANSTAYPNGHLSREQVVALALGWAAAGATVFVSEAEAVADLVARGWSAELLYEGRKDASRFRGKQEEWVTVSPPPTSSPA